MGEKKFSVISSISNNFLLYFFYYPFFFMLINSLKLWFTGSMFIEAITVQDTVLIIGGMIMSILHFILSIIIFKSPSVILGHFGDFLVGFLLLSSSFAGLIAKAWTFIFLLPFNLVKAFFGFDLLVIKISLPFKVLRVKFYMNMELNLRKLIDNIIASVIEAFKPDITPIEYFSRKVKGEIIGFQLNASSIANLLGGSALISAFKFKISDEADTDEE